jgi:hypothetical protein
VNGVQPYPQFGRIDVDQSISKSSYRGLYLRLDRRPTRFQYLVSYSLVKSEDNSPTARFVNQSDQGRDWGPSNAERRHSLVASGVVTAPFDIQVGAVWTYRSNLPFNAVAGRDLNADTFVTDFVPGTSRNQGNRDLDLGLVNAWRASLNLAPISAIDSTRYTSFDLRASKSVRVGGDRRAELVAQLFNVANTVNLSSAGFGTNATAATFGKASRAGAGRQAELGLRFIW